MTAIPVTTSQDAARRRTSSFFRRYSTLLALAALFIGFSIFVDRFLTPTNLVNILQQISMLTIVGIGLTFCFAAKEIDLSVGFVAAFAGLVVTTLMSTYDVAVPLAIAAGVGVGLVIGLVNALLVTLIGIPSLIVTLAMGTIVGGINFMISGGRAIYGGIPATFTYLGQGRIGIIPVVSLIMLGLVLLSYIVMNHSFFGRYVYALGGNPKATQLSGIPVRRYRILALVLTSMFAATAGILLAARLGSGQPTAGANYLLDGLATVFIGMTMLRPGMATVLGTFFGALFIGIVNNGLNLVGLDSYVQDIFKGAILILAVSIVSRQTTLKLL
ncbi:MAG: ABC transporter permease [Trueperaceae bacterium]|jgi:ribose/xylose/arabinose/galactoside ABC-type transport system permease subunit